MHSLVLSLTLALASFITSVYAQFGYPPPVSGLKRIQAPGNPDVFVTYKEPSNEICRTTNPKQKQYAGHIHLPPRILAPIQQDYPINTFFWFFEARENPQDAPLTIWLNGGPGIYALSNPKIGCLNTNGIYSREFIYSRIDAGSWTLQTRTCKQRVHHNHTSGMGLGWVEQHALHRSGTAEFRSIRYD
jgi:hypothetical protein